MTNVRVVVLQAFHTYLYLSSIAVLLYFFTAVFKGGLRWCSKKRNVAKTNDRERKGEFDNAALEVEAGTPKSETKYKPRRTVIAYHGEGMNLYIRIGAVGR